jgi:hypothetical protein
MHYMALQKIKLLVALVAALGIVGGGWWMFRNPSIAAPAVPEAKDPDIKLPADANAPVITFDHQGGFIARVSKDPMMVIHADGKIIVNDAWGIGEGGEGKLTRDQLQELLRFVVRDCDFFGYDPNKVTKALAEGGLKPAGGFAVAAPKDGTTVIVRVQAGDKEHEVRCHDVEIYAERYPSVKALVQMRDLTRRLRRLQVITSAGGPEAAAEALKLGNAELKKKFPEAPALTLADIFNATTRDGTTVIQFDRRKIDPADARTHVWASIVRPAKGEPKVHVEAVLKFVERPEINRSKP